MGRTLLDLFNDPDSFKYGTDYNNEIKDKPQGSGFVAGIRNYAEQEADGLRIKAATSIISIYGTQLIRITKQRTDLVESMKKSTGGESDPGIIERGLNGLGDTNLGRKVLSVKEKALNKLGFPKTPIPTFVVEDGTERNHFVASDMGVGSSLTGPGNEQDTMEYLAEIRNDAAGKLVGKLLKQGGGGTPKQILNQAAGGAIKTGKKVVRGALFGSGTSIGTNEPQSNDFNQIYGSGDQRYSKIMESSIKFDSTTSKVTDGRVSDLDGSSVNWLDKGIINNIFNTERKNDRDVDYLKNSNGYKYKGTLRKIFHKGQILNDENINTIIVKIGDIRFHLATITGISENLSPSWTGFRMIGSPFSSYMYDSIDRSVQFSLKLYASNPLEHKQNWDNINKLSKLVYPLEYIGIPGAIRPPITNLTLGDMYINKFGFIESLSYQIDDESSWELGRGQTEIDEYSELFTKKHSPYGGSIYDSLQTTDSVAWGAVQGLAEVVNYKLPKMIDISVTFKFIESRNDSEQSVIYAFKPAT